MITQTSSANQQPNIFKSSDVAAVFSAYPEAIRTKLLALRQLIFDTAAETEGVGELEETLKWGQPSYLTTTSKSGSTIRIDRASTGQYAIYFNCQTTLVDSFKDMFQDEFNYEGNRSILFNVESEIPVEKLRRDDLELRFFTTIASLGTPIDVTANELRIETYYPVDDATAAWARAGMG